MIRQQPQLKLWAVRVAIWSPAIALFFYFLGGLTPALDGASRPAPLAAMLFHVYSHTCHQIPERSFFLNQAQFGFCARCTGFYGGLALASLFVVITSRRRPISFVRLILLCLPILADVVFDVSGKTAIANELRFATGQIAAIAVILFTYPRFINAASKSLAPDRCGD